MLSFIADQSDGKIIMRAMTLFVIEHNDRDVTKRSICDGRFLEFRWGAKLDNSQTFDLLA